MKQLPTIETERLILRPFTLRDAVDVQRLAGARAIADTTCNIPHPYSDGVAEYWISKHQELFNNDQGLTIAITDRTNGLLMGAISLAEMVRNHQAELGYWLGEAFWNKGFCTEAAAAIIRFAFAEMRLLRVHAWHFSRNPASGRVMQKVGMRHEGTRRHHVRKWDKPEDIEVYGILKEEWE